MLAEMVIDTVEFLTVLKRLKPKRTTKATLAEEMYIALFNGEAIFCVRGIQTKCIVEKGHWFGYISVNSGVIQSFLSARPVGSIVKMMVRDNLFQIENLKVPCKTMRSPEWITAMSLEAHLHDDTKKPSPNEPLYCPHCGKKRGHPLDINLTQQIQLGDTMPSKHSTSRRCQSCKHEWLELADLS